MQKKTYETPDLIVYGTVETMTSASRYFSKKRDGTQEDPSSASSGSAVGSSGS